MNKEDVKREVREIEARLLKAGARSSMEFRVDPVLVYAEVQKRRSIMAYFSRYSMHGYEETKAYMVSRIER